MSQLRDMRMKVETRSPRVASSTRIIARQSPPSVAGSAAGKHWSDSIKATSLDQPLLLRMWCWTLEQFLHGKVLGSKEVEMLTFLLYSSRKCAILYHWSKLSAASVDSSDP